MILGGYILAPTVAVIGTELIAFIRNPILYCTANPTACIGAVDVAAGTAAGVPLTGVPVPHAVPNTGAVGAKEGDELAKLEAQNIANAQRLANDLKLQSANSPFAANGTLTQDAINSAKPIPNLEAGKLNNPAIPPGFGKYATDTFQSPAGNFTIHFYKNPTTGEVFYGLDYKVIFNKVSEIPKKP